jgi:hypothetical protein
MKASSEWMKAFEARRRRAEARHTTSVERLSSIEERRWAFSSPSEKKSLRRAWFTPEGLAVLEDVAMRLYRVLEKHYAARPRISPYDAARIPLRSRPTWLDTRELVMHVYLEQIDAFKSPYANAKHLAQLVLEVVGD